MAAELDFHHENINHPNRTAVATLLAHLLSADASNAMNIDMIN